MDRRSRRQLRALGLALLGVAMAGCAKGNGGKFALRNPFNGTMKESLSRLQHENQELEDSLASVKQEKRRLADELERAEGKATDLASRLDRAVGRDGGTSGGGDELADRYDPTPGGSSRPTRASDRARNNPPLTQIQNRIDVPSPPDSTDGGRARDRETTPLLDTPPVQYFDFDRDGGASRDRSRPEASPRPSSGTTWAPVPADAGRMR